MAVPAPARSLDLLDVAVDAAKAVGLPSVTKLDKAAGLVEFGSLDAPGTGYAAQVRRRPDGQLDVTVKRGTGSADDKARELVAALDARLQQGGRPATPSAPASPSAPSRQEPPPAQRSQPVVAVIVTAPQANLRERADANAKLVRVVPRNTRLSVLGKAAQWYMVRLADGTEGWVAESAVSPAR